MNPLVVDEGEDQAEFVDVTGQHQHGVALGIERGDPVSEGIAGIGVGCGLDMYRSKAACASAS
jgi:hypothetical protein